MTTDLNCPITGLEVGPVCERTKCMHNQSGSCYHQQVVALEGDAQAVAEFYDVSEAAVMKRVRDIQCALVANGWFEHITGRSILQGRMKDFDAAVDPMQAKEFASWRKTQFNFGQIIVMLVQLRARL